MKKIEIFDSTLRDGAQGEGISFSVQDKINIVKILDEFGVNYIEAGNPGSNPKDIEFFEKIKDLKLKNAKLCAFGSTRRVNLKVEEDANVLSLLDANTDVIAIFGKSWDLHVTDILNTTLEKNREIINDTISFFKSKNKEVIFDAEHFYDGYKENSEYAISVLKAAKEGGADVLCLCDTNGGTTPMEIYNITKHIKELFPDTRIGSHFHDDIGCAVASSMMAVEAGSVHVQGTFIGFGERCGNADLSIIMPNLVLKNRYQVDGKLHELTKTAIEIAEISNVAIKNNKPYVGRSAFAHKGGMHIDGVNKVSRSFEHINPELVGNERKFLMSEVSGRTSVLSKIKNYAPEISKTSPELQDIVDKLKEMEHYGYQYEASDASFELLVKKQLLKFKPHFSLIMYKTIGEYPAPDGEGSASAMIKVMVDDETEVTASIGNGPINALDSALRKALSVFYPQISKMHLTDYKVRVLDGNDATGARVRVLIESTDGESIWATVGVSTDIIEASWLALVDSIEYKLSKIDAEKNKDHIAD